MTNRDRLSLITFQLPELAVTGAQPEMTCYTFRCEDLLRLKLGWNTPTITHGDGQEVDEWGPAAEHRVGGVLFFFRKSMSSILEDTASPSVRFRIKAFDSISLSPPPHP